MKGFKALKGMLALILLLSYPTFSYGEDKVEGSASVSFMSSYVWRGFQLSDDEFVIQPGVGISYKRFTLSFWSDYNTGLDPSDLDETDITLDFSNTVGKVGYSIGYIYYSFDNALIGEDTQEVYGSFSYETILSPSLSTYWDFDEVESVYVAFAVGHDIKAGTFTVSTGASISYYFYDDNAMEDDWQNFEVSLATSVPVGPFSIDPMLAYSVGLYDGLDDEFYGGASLSLSF